MAEAAPDPSPAPHPILPPGVAPLAAASLAMRSDEFVDHVCDALAEGLLSDADVSRLLNSIPRDRMRRLVYEYAGMGAALLTTLSKQVQLVDSVLSQLVAPDGTLRPVPDGVGMTLKDAMGLSIKNSQMILRDLPKVYNVARVQRLEMAIGDVMEKHLTPEQQTEVLARLDELTTDKGNIPMLAPEPREATP